MRVVSVGAGYDRDPLLRALAAAGCPATMAGTTEMPPASLGGERYFYLGNAFEQIKAPFTLARIRRALARDGAPYVWWNRDAPWNCAIKPWRKLFVRASQPADVHLAHSLQSAELFGEPVAYFPNAAEADRYHLGARTLESLRTAGYRFDVSFVGTVSPGFKMVRARIEFLSELGRRLEPQGVKLHIFDTSIGSPLTVADQVAIIQASRINLNVGAVCDKPRRSWGIPERCFGIASCGGFLLCDERRHAADTFPADAWAEFSSIEECVARIRFFLRHFDRARDKAEKLHRIVLERHTYTVRARQLLELVTKAFRG
jgi:spore maturation protein CgeB